MDITFSDSYTKSESSFPSDRIPVTKKQESEYFKMCAKSILSRYVKNGCSFSHNEVSGKRSIPELRSYAKGTNSLAKYKDLYYGKKANQNASRKTSLNISWDIVQVIPQFVDVVRGFMEKFNYDIVVSAIDPAARNDKELMKAEMKIFLSDDYQQFAFVANALNGSKIVPTESSNPQIPQIPFSSPQEIEFFDSIGGFILSQEVALSTLLELSEDRSSWAGIKDLLMQDVITTSYMATRIYAESGSPIVKYDYVDIERAIFPHSRFNDHRDMTYFGYVRKMSIAEIRVRYGVPEDELLTISRAYAAKLQNPSANSAEWNNFRSGFYDSTINSSVIDSIMVDVVDCCWISTDYQKYTLMNREKGGNLIINDVNDDYELSDRSVKKGKVLKESSKQTLYECSMVVGTDTMLSFGKPNNLVYKKNDKGQPEIVFPYKVVKTGSSSIVERCIAFADDIQLAFLKFRNALKKSIPSPGMVISRSALNNVSINGVTQTPKMLLQALMDEGVLIVDDTDQYGQKITSVGNVIQFLPDQLMQQVTALKTAIEYFYDQMQRVTGINDLFSASTPSAETGVGVAKISISSTENSLFPIVNAYKQIYENSAQTCAAMWMINDYHTKEVVSIPFFIKNSLRYADLGGSLTYKDFGIRINAGLNTDEKVELLNQIRQLRDLRTQTGSGGITPSTYFMLWQVIQTGNIPKAMLLLAQAEERQIQKDQSLAQQNSQMNAQSQQQSAAQASQAKQAEIQQAGAINKDTKLAIQQAELVRETTKLQQEHGISTAQNQQAAQDATEQAAQVHQQALAQQQQASSEKLKEVALQNIYGKNGGSQYNENAYSK